MSSVKGGVRSVENEERETQKIEIIIINHKKKKRSTVGKASKNECMYSHISTMRRALKRLDTLIKVRCIRNGTLTLEIIFITSVRNFRKETEDYVRFPCDNNVHQDNKNTVSYNLYCHPIYYLYTQ